MRTLKRSECAVLHLVLKKKWFDMIASGEKREEYRDAKPYWETRLSRWIDRSAAVIEGDPPDKDLVVAFALGRTKPTMFFAAYLWPTSFAEVHDRSYWRPEWGEPRTPHYVIALGERVELED